MVNDASSEDLSPLGKHTERTTPNSLKSGANRRVRDTGAEHPVHVRQSTSQIRVVTPHPVTICHRRATYAFKSDICVSGCDSCGLHDQPVRRRRRPVPDAAASLPNQDGASNLSIGPSVMGNQVRVEIRVEGPPRRLTVPVEMNLLRIGQEAVTNAIKHAHAQRITLELRYDPETVCLRVTDDGRGFSEDEIALSGNGHFGLLDMRERAQALGCRLFVKSGPDCGTRIEVQVAANAKELSNGELQAHTYSGS